MDVVTYNFRVDKALRDEAFGVFADYGLSPSQAFKLFLKQVATTHSVPLNFDYQRLSDHATAKLKMSIQEIEGGDYDVVSDMDGFLAAVKND